MPIFQAAENIIESNYKLIKGQVICSYIMLLPNSVCVIVFCLSGFVIRKTISRWFETNETRLIAIIMFVIGLSFCSRLAYDLGAALFYQNFRDARIHACENNQVAYIAFLLLFWIIADVIPFTVLIIFLVHVI